MQQEPTDKLRCAQFHLFLTVVVTIVFPAETDIVFISLNHPVF